MLFQGVELGLECSVEVGVWAQSYDYYLRVEFGGEDLLDLGINEGMPGFWGLEQARVEEVETVFYVREEAV